MEWVKTNEKHLEDATPLLATLFAWELAGTLQEDNAIAVADNSGKHMDLIGFCKGCLLYTSPSPRDRTRSRMPSSA